MSSYQFNVNGSQVSKNNQNLRKYRSLAPKLPFTPMVNNSQFQQKALGFQLASTSLDTQVLPKPNIPPTAATAKLVKPNVSTSDYTIIPTIDDMETTMIRPAALLTTPADNTAVPRPSNHYLPRETNNNFLPKDDTSFQHNFLSYDTSEHDPQYQKDFEQENLLVSIRFQFL